MIKMKTMDEYNCLLCGKNVYGSKNYPRYRLSKIVNGWTTKIVANICNDCGEKLLKKKL